MLYDKIFIYVVTCLRNAATKIIQKFKFTPEARPKQSSQLQDHIFSNPCVFFFNQFNIALLRMVCGVQCVYDFLGPSVPLALLS